MGHYPKLEWNDKASLVEKVKAIYNVLNWNSHEMSLGRVKTNRIELQNNIDRANVPLSIAFVKMAEKGDIDEITASEHANMFLNWQAGVNFELGTLLQDEGLLYRVLQSHTSQEGWLPKDTPALYKVLGISDSGIPYWSQPISQDDAYMIGAEVIDEGKHWRNKVDYNVWKPRNIWLGGSRMIEIQDEILSGEPAYNIYDETGAKVYNNARIEMSTPVTQAGTQLNKAFFDIVMPSGLICMWSGTEIPEGWFLCDGTNGTPDLRNRFIVGAGSSYTVGSKGGNRTNILTASQLPAHTHKVKVEGDEARWYTNASQGNLGDTNGTVLGIYGGEGVLCIPRNRHGYTRYKI